MTSLSREKRYRLLLASFTMILLVGLLSPPMRASDGVGEQKLHQLDVLGLDVQDPTIQKAADSAYALYAVDVLPEAGSIKVVVRLSDLPSYKSSIYEERRRLVVDLYNTINIAPNSEFELSDADPVKKVRNAQFMVSPSIISRVVLDLNEGVTPEITTDGSDLVITVPMGAAAPSLESTMKDAEPAAVNEGEETVEAAPMKEAGEVGETIAVPAVEVEPEAPEVDVTATNEEQPAEAMENEIETLISGQEEMESEPEIEETPAEAATSEETEEAGKALNGMFSEMVEEEMQSAPAKESEPAEQMPESMVKTFGEMVSETPATTKLQPVMQPVAEEGGGSLEVWAPKDPTKMLLTLAFRDASLNAVLDIIARKGNLNIIAGKEVKGTVTVRLVDVPLDVALNAILNVNGYGYLKEENIIRILPLSEIGEVVNLSTDTYSLSYARADDAKKTLQSFLTQHGNIEVDQRTNMLVVTDVPANRERMENLIHQIDRRVKQVLIEVIILDSVLSDDADLGISWTLLNTDDNTPNTDVGLQDQIGIGLPTGANALNVVFGTMFEDLNLSVFIDAVVDDSDSRVLANPKILTLNNETATIEIVQEFPYNDVTQTSSGGQLSNITFKEIGTKLDVKPQITHDDHVILWVAPEQNSIAGTTSTGVPIVDTRKAETTLILKNHETIVMGGLRENRNVNTLTKVPVLGDLPVVKYVFRSVQSDKTDSELLVFLTVHIVEASPELLPEEKIKAEELANLPRDPNSTIELIRP